MSNLPAKRGRPSVYSEEIADLILERLADGEALAAICRSDGYPKESTVRMWAVDDTPPGFAARFARARDIGIDCRVERLIEIAETPQMGEITTTREWGTEVKRADMIEHRRLIVDTGKWYVSKIASKRYGNHAPNDGTNDNGDSTVRVSGGLPD